MFEKEMMNNSDRPVRFLKQNERKKNFCRAEIRSSED